MFDEKTIKQLKYYVYLLIDPTNNEPFYVGKGQGNRVFDHISQKNGNGYENLKYQEIKRIGAKNVKHIIVRHGLKEDTAFKIEASLIDTFQYIPSFNKFVRGNIQGGYNSIEKGLMSSNEIKSIYNAELLTKIDDNCMIININKNYKRGAGVHAIYKATKETWRMAYDRLSKYNYVLSEYRGLICEVFEIKRWYAKERHNKHGDLYTGYGFDGNVAEIKIRNKYINKSIKEIKPHGYSSPIIYPERLRIWISEM